MKYIYLNANLKLLIPDNWEIENHGSIISLFDPIDGIGALEFSFYDVPNVDSLNLVKELEEYLSDKYEEVNIIFNNTDAYFSTIFDNRYWRYWLIKTLSY
jgi:hypothetical protein